MKKYLIGIVVALALLFCLGGCSKGEQFMILEDKNFGAVSIGASLEDFLARGFELGDAVRVDFPSGQVLTDVPVLNGYYVATGKPLICLYPGYDYPSLAFAQGQSMWTCTNSREGQIITITLEERGRYKSVQEAFSLVYSNDRGEFESDEQFANFRAISGGKLAPGRVYRSASPLDNKYNRAPYVVKLAEQAGIGYIIDMADNMDEIEAFMAKESFDSVYYTGLLEGGHVAALDLGANFMGEGYGDSLCRAFLEAARLGEPVLVHCQEGKDRTGFAGALVLALVGASEQEIIDDYMITYYNYYKLTEAKDPARYAAVVDVKAMDFINSFKDLGGTVQAGARKYFQNAGLTEAEIDEVVEYLTK